MSNIQQIETFTEESTSQIVETSAACSIIIVNYNGRDHIIDCIRGIQETTGRDAEIIVVDNGSTDGSPDELEDLFPEVRLIRSPENTGFAAGNDLGVNHAQGEYLIFLNPDTKVTPGWLGPLLAPLETGDETGLATSKILLLDSPDLINAAGNDMQLTGLTLCRGLGLPKGALSIPAPVTAVSGAAFSMRRDLYMRLGGFDRRFFMYMEDTDLSLRARLAGYEIEYAPDSIVYHDYGLNFGADKIFYQERNRYLLLLKSLRWLTLVLLLPALSLAEVVTWGYSLLYDRRNWTNKIRAYGYILSHWPEIMDDRSWVQALRRVPDSDLLRPMVYRLDYGQTGAAGASKAARLVFDPLFRFWRAVTLTLIRW